MTVPTLYLWGTNDVAFDRSAAEASSTMVDADYHFVELEGHGHWLPESASPEILDELLPHLDR